jgi:hypothetical protein
MMPKLTSRTGCEEISTLRSRRSIKYWTNEGGSVLRRDKSPNRNSGPAPQQQAAATCPSFRSGPKGRSQGIPAGYLSACPERPDHNTIQSTLVQIQANILIHASAMLDSCWEKKA